MHLFYRCHQIKHVLDELKHIFNIIFEKNIVLVEENLIIGVYEGEITEDLSEFGNLYIKMGNLENKKLYEI